MKTISEYQLKKNPTNFVKEKITESKHAADYARKFYHDDISIYESFFLIMLNNNGQTIGYVKISQGGITGTVVDPIIIAKYAIDSLAKSVILCHNHPSGSDKPSSADKNITDKVKNGLNMFDINVLDHIILTENSYYSFQDNHLL